MNNRRMRFNRPGVVMSIRKIRILLIAAISVVLSLSGCITRTRRLTPDQVLLPAETLTKPALLQKIRVSSTALKTLKVINSTLKVTQQITSDQLKEFGKGLFKIDAVIAVERPNKLRLQVQFSGITAADLESDDRQFRIFIPHVLNAYGIGNVTSPVGAVSFPCNLRPSHILDALFVDGEKYFDNQDVGTVRIERTEGIRSFYIVEFYRRSNDSPIEELWYDRTDKQVTRKIQYTEDGREEAIVRYSNYATIDSIPFPREIEIKRPMEHYTLEMKISDMVFNEVISASSFQVDRPSNANDLDLSTCKVKPR
jgi:hypothetical protein